MSKSKNVFSLSGMIDSSPERPTRHTNYPNPNPKHNQNMMRSPDSAVENMPITKKPRVRAKPNANKITKTKASSRRTSPAAAVEVVSRRVVKGKAAGGKRAVLQEQVNEREVEREDWSGSEEEEVDVDMDGYGEGAGMRDRGGGMEVSEEELDSSIVESVAPKVKKSKVSKAPNGPIKRSKAAAKVDKSRPINHNHDDDEEDNGAPESPPKVENPSKARVRASKTTARAASKTRPPKPTIVQPANNANVSFIAETQPSPIDNDDSLIANNTTSSPPPQPAPRAPRQTSRAPSATRNSRAPSTIPAHPRHDDGPEPKQHHQQQQQHQQDATLRRKLGDMTRRCESLDLRYRTLRDVGVREADANFDRLKRESAEKNEGNPSRSHPLFIPHQHLLTPNPFKANDSPQSRNEAHRLPPHRPRATNASRARIPHPARPSRAADRVARAVARPDHDPHRERGERDAREDGAGGETGCCDGARSTARGVFARGPGAGPDGWGRTGGGAGECVEGSQCAV